MSQFKVYTETGINSIAFDTLAAAKEWAHESNGWFEVVDLVKNDIVYTAEEYEFGRYYSDRRLQYKDCLAGSILL